MVWGAIAKIAAPIVMDLAKDFLGDILGGAEKKDGGNFLQGLMGLFSGGGGEQGSIPGLDILSGLF